MTPTAKTYCPECFKVIHTEQTRCPHCQAVLPQERNPLYLNPPFQLYRQYIIGKVLGHGGFGITYLGFDRNLNTRVAIKEYFPAEFASRAPDGQNVIPYGGEKTDLFQVGREKFMAEARLLASLRSPNIVRIRHFFEACNTAYFIMEYLEGQTLTEWVKQQGGRLKMEQVKKILFPLLNALHEVHAQNTLHRDIKPDNIWLTREGVPILLDFGAARHQMSGATKNLLSFLTPGFAPAEQYSTNGIQGPWTDIYALAATLYYALTGTMPPTPQDRMLGDIALKKPSELGAAVSPDDENWLLKGLEIKWSQRPESIAQWQTMIEAAARPGSPPIPQRQAEEENFLRIAILPRLTSRFLTPQAEQEIHESAAFMDLSRERVQALIEQALLMTGSTRRNPQATPSQPPVAPSHAPPPPPPVTVQKPMSPPPPAQPVSKPVTPPAASPPPVTPPLKNDQPKKAFITPPPPPPPVAEVPRSALVKPAPRLTNLMGMDFVLIEPGQNPFAMGKPEDHYQVRLTRPYYLQTTPVTQGHWRMVMGSNPACFQGDEWRPVEQVSWHDCQHFIQRLNSLREGHYRLPTEAEWEYACRAGQSGAYSFGNRAGELPEYAWFDLNARGTTHPTGLKKANKFGLFDMHGNVWEWVQDRHGSFPNAVLTDPNGPTTGETRVIRGGAWNLSAAQCRADSRNYDVPEYSFRNLGLRLLLEVSDSFKL